MIEQFDLFEETKPNNSKQTIIHGDCLKVMAGMAHDSIDFCVTDPPYGLHFMGKGWDSFKFKKSDKNKTGARPGDPTNNKISDSDGSFKAGTYDESRNDEFQHFITQFGKHLLRILKPGGHIAMFGAPRRHHRQMSGLEDAGFEIRDCIMWLFGQGFPKSHNHFGLPGYGTALKPAHEIVMIAQKPLTQNMEQDIIVENLIKIWCQLCLMLPVNVAEKFFMLSHISFEEALNFAQWNAEKKSNIQVDLSVLMDMSQLEKVMISCLNIVSSWKAILEDLWKDGNISIIKTKINPTIDLKTLNYYLSQLTPLAIIQEETKQLGSWLNVLPAPRYLNAVLKNINAIQELFALENAIESDGLNLCPSYTPIILAMKPLDGTYAQNVERWGIGGINIDESRIQTTEDLTRDCLGHASALNHGYKRPYHDNKHMEVKNGRWPSNVILDEESAQLLDQQSGILKSGLISKHHNINQNRSTIYQDGLKSTNGLESYGDSGGASRFFKIIQNEEKNLCVESSCKELDVINKNEKNENENLRFKYCAKASSRERNKGLEKDLSKNDTSNLQGQNFHPTVKPFALMKYIIKLLAPPNNPILIDPFLGSGTTLLACKDLGISAIGIEKEEEYFNIAKQRLKNWNG